MKTKLEIDISFLISLGDTKDSECAKYDVQHMYTQ